MKCMCSECGGTGHVACPECDGQGAVTTDLRVYKIPEGSPHYDELRALQQDAQRCTSQAVRLRKLRPERSGSYTEQELATLAAIHKQADKLLAGQPIQP